MAEIEKIYKEFNWLIIVPCKLQVWSGPSINNLNSKQDRGVRKNNLDRGEVGEEVKIKEND